MKRVLVTGAGGFIGRHCLELLKGSGYDVVGVSTRLHPPEPGVAWRRADLLAPGAAQILIADARPTHLLHLAWFAEPGAFWEAAENFAWVSASQALFEAFARGGGQRIVAAGSCAEYDWRGGWCDEARTPLAPISTYGACKRAASALLDEVARRHGLSAAWGRVFFLYGPGEDPRKLVASVISKLLRGEPARCSSGEQRRDFLHVADVARGLVALLDSSVPGPVNISSGAPVPVREVILKLAAAIGRPDLIQLGAATPGAAEPPLIAGVRGRLYRDAGWAPAFDLDSGLANAIASWRAHLAETSPYREPRRASG